MIKCWNLGYKNSKEKAKNIYNKIGNVQCPIFNDEPVSFTSFGFSHLIRRGRIIRSKNEQKKRFRLIPYVERMVKNPTLRATIEYEEKEVVEKINRFGEKIIRKRKAKFWTLIETIEDCKVKLVIGEIRGGGKKFISIMGDNRPVPK